MFKNCTADGNNWEIVTESPMPFYLEWAPNRRKKLLSFTLKFFILKIFKEPDCNGNDELCVNMGVNGAWTNLGVYNDVPCFFNYGVLCQYRKETFF